MAKKKTISANDVDQMTTEELYASWGTTREEHMSRMKSLIARKNAEAMKLLGKTPESPKVSRVSRASSALPFGGFTAVQKAAINKLMERYALKTGIAKGMPDESVTFIVINGHTYNLESLKSNLQQARGRMAKKGKLGKFGRIMMPEGMDLAALRSMKMELVKTPEGKQGLVVNTMKGLHKFRGKKKV